MTKKRAITSLELTPAWVSGKEGWVHAEWRRADGSGGEVVARFRLRTAERWYIAWLQVSLPTTALLRDVPLAKIETAANADPEIREWIEKGSSPETIERAHREASTRPRLERPESHQLDDGFFALVGAAYTAAAAAGLAPAKTLADESETPQGTVNRWIAEARRRGHLPPGEPGRVTA